MRIIAGCYGGRRIKAPPGRIARPTTDRVREAVFSMLGSTPEGIRVVDLYAGSGAMGLEALSRGAAHCCFVDRSRQACQVIRGNLSRLGVDETRWMIRRQKVEDFLKVASDVGVYQLFFADPPYDDGFADGVVGQLNQWPGRGTPAIAVVEFSARICPKVSPDELDGEGARLVGDRTYGNSRIVMFRYDQEEDVQ